MRLFLLWFLIASPALPFIALSLSYWRIVRQKIDEALRRLHAFPSELYGQAYGSFSKEEQDPYGVMKAELEAFHNWRTYYVPIALTCVIASIFVAISLLHFGVDIGLPDDFARMGQRTLPTVIVGAGGAYLWGVHDLIRRHRTADMSSTALHTTWLRMLVSAAIGALIGGLFETDFELIAAFAVGALPIEDAKQWLTAKLNLNLNNLPSHPPYLHLIQGMSVGVQSRLMDENIDRVQALAFADPVRLLFRTNIEWNVILDLVDQAMLINFAGTRSVTCAWRELEGPSSSRRCISSRRMARPRSRTGQERPWPCLEELSAPTKPWRRTWPTSTTTIPW